MSVPLENALMESPPPPRPAGLRSWAAAGDGLFRLVCQGAAALILAVMAVLVGVLVWQSWLAIRTVGFGFLTRKEWDPVHRVFGSLAFVYGTVVTSLIALVIAVPLGVGTAAFLSEIARGRLRQVATFFIEMLAAIPSVVYGFWGIYVLAPALQRLIAWLGGPNTGGFGILAAGLILSIMIVPYIAAISYDVCQAVPRSQREGSLALGATRWQTIRGVVLPYARPGIVGGCFLALGRALGETMAVTMLIGNRPEIALSPFALGDSIASVIANQYMEAPYDLYRSVLVALGLLLLLVTIVINSLARLLLWRVATRVRQAARRDAAGRPGHNATAPAAGAAAAAAAGVRQPLPPVHRGLLSARQVDRLMTGVLSLCMAAVMAVLLLILAYLVYKGAGSLTWSFFTELPGSATRPGGGMANGLVGSFKIVGLATLFAVPVGLLAAIFLAEYRRNPLSSAVRFVGELLGGVPSIVIGIFAAALFAGAARWHKAAFGRELHFYGWAGVFALAVMMVPIVLRASEEAIRLVPQSLRNASYALGASHAQTVLRVTVPAALPAIITGVFLSVARIAGETAPLLLTAGFNRFWPDSLNDFTPTLPVYIFKYAGSAYPNLQRQAWAAAFVLMVVVIVLNFGIRFVTGKRVVLAGRAD
jgi:phosphate transport system permease protein